MRLTGRRGRFVHKPRESSPPDLEETRAETVPRCESLRVCTPGLARIRRGNALRRSQTSRATATMGKTDIKVRIKKCKIDKPMSKELKVKVRRRRH